MLFILVFFLIALLVWQFGLRLTLKPPSQLTGSTEKVQSVAVPGWAYAIIVVIALIAARHTVLWNQQELTVYAGLFLGRLAGACVAALFLGLGAYLGGNLYENTKFAERHPESKAWSVLVLFIAFAFLLAAVVRP